MREANRETEVCLMTPDVELYVYFLIYEFLKTILHWSRDIWDEILYPVLSLIAVCWIVFLSALGIDERRFEGIIDDNYGVGRIE